MSNCSQIVKHNGIEAELYLPSRALDRAVAVLVVAGSRGGLHHRETAQHLAEAGFPAFALAHFAYGGLPPALHNIPLEYFFHSIEQMQAHSELRNKQIVAMGSSRGAELVLQLASLDPRIRGVIATSPSHVRWGATGKTGAAWLYKGRPLPFVVPIASDSFTPSSYQVAGVNYAIYKEWYSSQLVDNPSVGPATIPIERVNGPILLFSGADDQLWPSTLFANRIEARVQANNSTFSVINMQYKNVGHKFPLPGKPPVLHTLHPTLNSGVAYGGSSDEVKYASVDRWNRIVSFLRHLG